METLLSSSSQRNAVLVRSGYVFSIVPAETPTQAKGTELPDFVMKHQVTFISKESYLEGADTILLKNYSVNTGVGNTPDGSGQWLYPTIYRHPQTDSLSVGAAAFGLNIQDLAYYMGQYIVYATWPFMKQTEVEGEREALALRWVNPISKLYVSCSVGNTKVKVYVSSDDVTYTQVFDFGSKVTDTLDVPPGTKYVRLSCYASPSSTAYTYRITGMSDLPVVEGYDDFELVSAPVKYLKDGETWFGCTRILCTHDINKAGTRMFVPRPLHYADYGTLFSNTVKYKSTNPLFLGEKK